MYNALVALALIALLLAGCLPPATDPAAAPTIIIWGYIPYPTAAPGGAPPLPTADMTRLACETAGTCPAAAATATPMLVAPDSVAPRPEWPTPIPGCVAFVAAAETRYAAPPEQAAAAETAVWAAWPACEAAQTAEPGESQ